MRAKQEERPPAVARQHPPHNAQNCGALIGALQLHKIREAAVRQPHNFLNFTVMSLVLPYQQIGDSAWIVEIASHKPRRDDGHVLAVEPRPESKEVLMPAASLSSFSLLHRLIPVTILSSKVRVTGRICKEGVKVSTPESPASADDAPFNLAALQVAPHCARAETQHLRRFA
jgi:hypothetical protein